MANRNESIEIMMGRRLVNQSNIIEITSILRLEETVEEKGARPR